VGERSEPTVTGPKSGSREAVIEDLAGFCHPYRGFMFGWRSRGLASLTPGYLLSPLRGFARSSGRGTVAEQPQKTRTVSKETGKAHFCDEGSRNRVKWDLATRIRYTIEDAPGHNEGGP